MKPTVTGIVAMATALFFMSSSAFGQNTLTLNIGQVRDTIQREIYGALMEDWGRDIYGGIYVGTTSTIPNTNGMRNDIIDGLKQVNIGVLQWPGGCHAEVYNWRNGIGAKASRPGGERANGMGTDEYFQLCEILGSAPFLQANCKESTPAEMAAWLNYIHDKFPNQLKYLGMGNEPWGGCYPGISIKQYITNWYDPFVAAIPPVFSGKIKRVAAAGYTDQGTTTHPWTEIVLQQCIGKTEGLSWHYYTTMSWTEGQRTPSINFNETQYYNILDRAYAMEQVGNRIIQIMNTRDPDNTIALQPDEWGAWYDQIPGNGLSYQQSTVRDALITAQHFNYFNNNCRRIRLSQSAQPANAIHALFLTHPTSGALIKTPTFYVYKLYMPHHKARMVPSTLSSSRVNNLNALNASASINSEGKLHISIGNIHATAAQTLTITINGGTFSNVSGQIVTGPNFNSYNDYNTAERVNIQPFAASNFSLSGNSLTVTLPKHSVVMLSLSPTGTGVIGHASGVLRNSSIVPLPGRRIMVVHRVKSALPVTLSLFTVDGRMVVPPHQFTATPDVKRYIWFPALHDRGIHCFVLKVAAGGVTTSRRVVLYDGK
jgi:alpha-L-arabinofuranosidase